MQLSIIEGSEQIDSVSGFANAELGIPMTQDTVIQIGSVTKVFNATMVMSLVEAGQLDLDVPVKRYIPEFELSDPKATLAITLQRLVVHRPKKRFNSTMRCCRTTSSQCWSPILRKGTGYANSPPRWIVWSA